MEHGANIYKYAKQLQCSVDEIQDFSSNINSYHPRIDTRVTHAMLTRYEDSNYTTLKNSITLKYGVKHKQIALYNGATSAIHSLFDTLHPKHVYLYAPLYGEYEKALKKTTKVVKINRFKALYTKPKKNATVVFVNPSTPDGKYYKLKKLFKIWKQRNCTIILDESFLEFESLPSFRDTINSYKKLYIVQSFSKFYSCAGVRIGAIFSHEQNIKKLHTPLWNLSSFDVALLSPRLVNTSFEKMSKKLHKMHKEELIEILENSKLFSHVYASDSNFILVQSKKAKKIFKHLLAHKILVRTCESFDYLNHEYLRFGVKNIQMHHKLKKAFNTFFIKKKLDS